MQNNADYQEIVQTVTTNVLTDVKSQLESMKSEIADDIVKRVESSIQTSLNSFFSQLVNVYPPASQSSVPGYPSRPAPVQPLRPIDFVNYSPISPQLGVDTEACKLLLLIQSWPHIVYKGWILYLDYRASNHQVYMVRENGANITDISSYFGKRYVYYFITIVESGSDWLVKYGRSVEPDDVDVAVIPMP